MALGELRARTALLPKRDRELAAAPKQKLTGIELAAFAADVAVLAPPAIPRIAEAEYEHVPAYARAISVEGAQSFAPLAHSIDGLTHLAVRQRAFLRVLETFGSEWVPDATSRALWNGTAKLAGGLKQRNLWEPFVLPKPAQAKKLDHAEQERFIDEVLAPCWSKMVADTSKAPSPENLRGLIELHGLWEGFSKGFWPAKQGALSLEDTELASLVERSGPKDALLAAAVIAPLKKAASELIADRHTPKLDKDQTCALLYIASKNGAVLALNTLVGARLKETQPLESWRAWVAEPPVLDVKAWTTRLHGLALVLPHLGAPEETLWNAWKDRASQLDLTDVETAAKLHAVAVSLRSTRGFGYELPKKTLELMPEKTVVQLALMPVPAPKIEKGKALPPDPVREARDQAAQMIYGNVALAERMLEKAGDAAERRECLKLVLGALDRFGGGDRAALSAAVSRTVNALLADPSTIDEVNAKKPSPASLQTLLFAAQRVPAALRIPLALDRAVLSPFLPARSAAELAGLLQATWQGGQDPWIGKSAAEKVRAELYQRLSQGTLEPHPALLAAALGKIEFDPHAAVLESWLKTQAAVSPEQHGAALLAVAGAFSFHLDETKTPPLNALLLRSFGELPDPKDREATEKMFGLAKKLEASMRGPHLLTQNAANRAPLELCLAPFLENYPIFPGEMYAAGEAFRARITELGVEESRHFLESAKDPAELTERLGLIAGAACGVGLRQALATDAKQILERAVQPALSALAKRGDPTAEATRRAVLFLPSGARPLGAVLEVDAANAAPFAKKASTEDLLKLCLDPAITKTGVREAANAAIEERIARSPIGEKRDRLRVMLDSWEKLTSTRFSATKVEEERPWNVWVDEELDRLDGKPWSAVWSALDQQAQVAEAPAGIGARVDNVVALYPPSRDRNLALARALCTEESGVPFSTLETISSWELSRTEDIILRPDRRLLSAALLGHPDGPFALVSMFEGRTPSAGVPPRLEKLWKSFAPDAKKSVASESFEKLFELAYGDRYHSKAPDPKIRSALEKALETEVFAPLAADQELEKLVDRLRPIFAALPRKVQARVATAFALEAPPAHDAPAVLRCLLENAGVVAIKVAQQICEDPAVPQRFRDVLESLRDQNLEIDVFGAWSMIGRSGALHDVAQQGYALLGKRLGTGSVKQANRILDEEGKKPPAVIAFLKPGAAEEIEESLRALSVDDELRPIVDRVRSMLMRELDLGLEARAFRAMAQHLAPWDFIRVPKVFGSSREALVREMSPGTPVSAILRERVLDGEEKRVLGETYRSLVQAALDPARFVYGNGFVLTDPHQGNVALDRAADGRVYCDLFDPGQYETLKGPEAALFVRLVVHLSKGGNWFAPKKDELLEQLTLLLAPKDTERTEVRRKLRDAWETAIGAKKDVEPGEAIRAWLFAAADRGVPIPDAYFGMAKMLHTIDAQCRDLGLADVISEEVGRLYKADLPLMKAIHKLWPWS